MESGKQLTILAAIHFGDEFGRQVPDFASLGYCPAPFDVRVEMSVQGIGDLCGEQVSYADDPAAGKAARGIRCPRGRKRNAQVCVVDFHARPLLIRLMR